jgi:hypothetical protein
VMQSLINGSYGLAIGIGLYFVGLPYSLLWGLFAGLLRFIPYAGVWIGLLVPSVLAWAVFPGWLWPLVVMGLFLVLEFTVSMVLEPLLYGHSAGISQVALLIAIAFWAWIWGPVGMIIATPITVCLVVLGKYIPQMSFLVVLMSDEPVMQTEVTYYQRLLASDYEEAVEIVEDYLGGDHAAEQVYDQVLLPAVYQAKLDYRRGKLTATDEEFVNRATSDIIEEIDIDDVKHRNAGDGAAPGNHEERSVSSAAVKAVACPARDDSDALALRMLQRLLDTEHCHIEIAPRSAALDVQQLGAGQKPVLICIGSVAPGGMAQARHLAKKLRAQLPKAKILIGRWGLANEFSEIEEQRKLLLAAGADQVDATLIEARNHILQFCSEPRQPMGGEPRKQNEAKEESAKT